MDKTFAGLKIAAALAIAAGTTLAAAAPQHLQNRPDELYARADGKIVKAPPEDLAVARGYPGFARKGKIARGQRITIMSARTAYRVGEPVRVVHVLEAPQAGVQIFVMGPKPIEEEYVDGKLASPPRRPTAYDGAVLESPAVDFNYEVSVYKFDKPGAHAIQWKGGGATMQGALGLVSNVLRVVVIK